MKRLTAFAIGLALTSAATGASTPIATAAFDLRLEVPADHGPQDVNTLRREFPVGGSSGWHVHPGTEVAYLLSGDMELLAAGQPPRRMKPGEHFVMPRGVAHNGINRGRRPAVVMITYIVDRGAPVRSAVTAP